MKIGILADLCLSLVDPAVSIDHVIKDFSKSTILCELNKNKYNIVNLEAPITNSNQSIAKTGPHLKNPREVIDVLKLMKVQICTLANNHIFDYGFEGLKETIDVCEEHGIQTNGAGLNLEKIREPLVISENGIRVSVVSFAENEFNTIDLLKKGVGSNDLDLIEICDQIKLAKSISDYLILIVHGGHEDFHFPSPRIKKLYHFFIDMGADAVVAHHPHVFQGYEEYNGRPIFYSLGNYLFPSTENSKSNQEGFAVLLDISVNKLSYNIMPYTQSAGNFQVNLMEGEQKVQFLEKLKILSDIIRNDDELEKKWLDFIQIRKESFLISLFPFNPKITRRLIKFGLDKFFVPKDHFLKSLNLIRCESHRDVLIKSLLEKNKI